MTAKKRIKFYKVREQINQLRKNKTFLLMTQSQERIGSQYLDLVFDYFDEALKILNMQIAYMVTYNLSSFDKLMTLYDLAGCLYQEIEQDYLPCDSHTINMYVQPLLMLHRKYKISINEIERVVLLYCRYSSYKFKEDVYITHPIDFNIKFNLIREQFSKKDEEVQKRAERKTKTK